jgi:DNA-directed RNA polymerase II subunit RPB1
MFKRGQMIKQDHVVDIKNKIINTIVRGVTGIEVTYVTKKAKSYIDENGNLKSKRINIITTKGTNFAAIVDNPYLDSYRCQSDSIKEIEEMFGIEAARYKLRSELEKVGSEMGTVMAAAHYSVFCDELCITGKTRGISKSGLEMREPKNALLRISYSHMNQVIKSAANNGRKSEIYGISATLMLGRAPYVGSTYNKISIDHDFISDNTQSIDELFEDL